MTEETLFPGKSVGKVSLCWVGHRQACRGCIDPGGELTASSPQPGNAASASPLLQRSLVVRK